MVAIKDYKISANEKIIDATDMQILYFPLVTKYGYQYTETVSPGTYVYIGSILGKCKINDLPLLSSVSGVVVGLQYKYISSGALVKCIVVENDFKDKYLTKKGKKQNINNYNKLEFLTILKDSAISGLSGSDMPTYVKYDTDEKINYLIINGMECEIYSSTDNAVMYHKTEEILEGIDAIMEIMDIKKAYIAITEDNNLIISKFLKYINTYPNIKIYPVINAYPMGYEKFLVNEILNLNYDKYPSEVGVISENVSTIYAIYEALKYHKPLVERIVTISGDGIKNAGNYKVRIGTNFMELSEKYHLYNNLSLCTLVAGGAMMGKAIGKDDLIITKDLTTVLVLKRDNQNESVCIKCGKCSEVCPVNLMPSLIMQHRDLAKDLKISKCIECGLCSYVCPAKIEVREHIKEIKEQKNERI